ncbi:MAG: hypothetical protein GTN80_03870 [Nitrososphaeria archaeon]|nr:hypothetical protein [Nitrososphaeria archaeon]NIN52288.1 hypothetical protein [Nitrososphaeria archaeon]NIQ32766.1 hypothetical protein [Nitrososphaeria archaeon]
MKVFDLLEKIVDAKIIGPKPSFSKIHAANALLVLGKERLIGRSTLAKRINIGPGAVKTLVSRLKEENMIIVRRGGIVLSRKGHKMYEEMIGKMPVFTRFDDGKLAISDHNMVAVVRGAADEVSNGLRQRDSAITAGGFGATTLIYKDDRFYIPPETAEHIDKYPNSVWERLKALNLKQGDVIIIVSADSDTKAELATLSVIWTLIKHDQAGHL